MQQLHPIDIASSTLSNHLIDVLIIGGGCAGLSLARELTNQGFEGQVVVVEPRHQYDEDRSWCFWAPHQHELSSWVHTSWSHWSFGLQGQQPQTRSSRHFTYQYIRSIDFYLNSLSCLAHNKKLRLMLGESVLDLQKDGLSWRVQTTTQTLLAATVIDTRPPSKSRLNKSTLYQCFVGYEIQHTKSPPQSKAVEVMTDMKVVDGDFCFTYALPLPLNQELIEVTYFSRRPIDNARIDQDLRNVLTARGLAQPKIMRKEFGVLPMGLPPTQQSPDGIYFAGTGGGALRPSSGYGFLRIQKWATHFARSLIEKKPLPLNTEIRGPLKYMDKLFLQVLLRDPSCAPEIFNTLFTSVEPDKLIRFMNEESSYPDLLAVVSSMPKKPFMVELLRLARS